jgi:hypothetical protein
MQRPRSFLTNEVLTRRLETQAELANRDFAGERQGAAVVVTAAGPPVAKLDSERQLEERRAAHHRNAHRLRIPRRPRWSRNMTPDQLDAHEREAFLKWRRELARRGTVPRAVLAAPRVYLCQSPTHATAIEGCGLHGLGKHQQMVRAKGPSGEVSELRGLGQSGRARVRPTATAVVMHAHLSICLPGSRRTSDWC